MVQLLGFQITRANDDKEKPAEVKTGLHGSFS